MELRGQVDALPVHTRGRALLVVWGSGAFRDWVLLLSFVEGGHRGTSPIRNSPLPQEHHRTLGMVLL